MKILFITSSRIGDAVLSSGLLSYMAQTYPDAKVTIACGPLAVSLFEGFPLLERIIPLKKQKYSAHWFDLWKQVALTRWDLVVDLRNSVMSRFVLSKATYIYGKHIDCSLHKVQQNAAVMGLDVNQPPAPKLWFSEKQLKEARALLNSGDKNGGEGQIVACGPAANWLGKTWPAERFSQILDYLTGEGGAYDGARVAVFGAPGEEEICRTVYDGLPEDRRIDMIAKGSPGLAAAALSQCAFYFGNDSGLMHAAAASNVPTFGVFGPSYPHLYSPWGAHCHYARTPESFDELIDYEGYTPCTAPSLMGSLSVAAVVESLDDFLEKQSSSIAAA